MKKVNIKIKGGKIAAETDSAASIDPLPGGEEKELKPLVPLQRWSKPARNGAERMMMRRIRRVPFLMLVGIMVAAPAAFADDFLTGMIVGGMLSDNSDSKKVNDTGPKSKTVIEYHDGQPVVTKMESFISNKWRELDGPQGGYFICSGEYRSDSGRLRCRKHDDGFNGFMGGMTDAQELPLVDALTKMEGKPILLQTIKAYSNKLAVEYQLVPPAPASLSVPMIDYTRQKIASPNTDSNISAFRSPLENTGDTKTNGFLDSYFIRVLAGVIPLCFIAVAVTGAGFVNNQRDSETDEL